MKREIKDSLFRNIFINKEYLVELYYDISECTANTFLQAMKLPYAPSGRCRSSELPLSI